MFIQIKISVELYQTWVCQSGNTFIKSTYVFINLKYRIKNLSKYIFENRDYKSVHLMTSLENYIHVKGNYFQNHVQLHNVQYDGSGFFTAPAKFNARKSVKLITG